MTRFTFQGTGQTAGGGVSAGLIAGAAAGVTLAAVLWLILWVLAVAVGVVVVLAVPGLILLHRYNRRQAQQFAVAMQARHAAEAAEAAARPRIAPAQPQVIVNHFYDGQHVHMSGDTAGIVRQLPDPDR